VLDPPLLVLALQRLGLGLLQNLLETIREFLVHGNNASLKIQMGLLFGKASPCNKNIQKHQVKPFTGWHPKAEENLQIPEPK
jgi:hypothetical protein